MRLLRKVNALFDRTLDYLSILSGVLVVFIMLSICFEIIARYLGHPTIWVQEIAEITILYIVFLGTAWVLKRGGHVTMDAVVTRLRPKIRSLLAIIGSIMGIVISLILIWYGTRVTWSYFERGLREETLLELPIAPILIIIPIGSFFLLIQFLRQTHGDILRWKTLPDKEQSS